MPPMLAAGDLWVNYPADVVRSDDARDTHRAEVGIDLHFSKHGSEGIGREFFLFLPGRGLAGGLDKIASHVPEQGTIRDRC
jgi:hypothetical protein